RQAQALLSLESLMSLTANCLLFLDQLPKPHDRSFNLITPRFAAADADTILKAHLGGKQVARRDADLVPQGALVQLERVDFFVEFDPQHESTLRARHAHVVGKVFRYRLRVAHRLRMQRLPKVAKVQLVPAHAEEMPDGSLRKRIGGNGVHAFKAHDLILEPPRDNPSYPEAGCQRFGKRAAMQYQSLLIVALARAGTNPAVIHFTIDLVLDKRDISFRQHLDQLLFIFVGHATSHWVVEVGNEQACLYIE